MKGPQNIFRDPEQNRMVGDIIRWLESLKSAIERVETQLGIPLDSDGLADNAISTSKIQTGAVDGTKIKYKTITYEQIADETITGDKIGSGEIGADKLVDGSSGWHGSKTRIKILPSDFISTQHTDINDIVFDNNKNGASVSAGTKDMVSCIPLPQGFKATAVMVYGSDSGNAITVYECNIADSSAVSKGTGTIGTEINITDVSSSTTNYLGVWVDTGAADDIYGGYVTIEEI